MKNLKKEKSVVSRKAQNYLNRSNAYKHAEFEFNIMLKQNNEELVIKPFIEEILELVDKFGKSGQSGGSAPYTAGCIISNLKNLLAFKPLLPITGIKDEWNDTGVKENRKILFQNKRLSSIFKVGNDGIPYYLDAIVWKDGKNCFTGWVKTENGRKSIGSRQNIKLPFEPKTFYVNVELIGEQYRITSNGMKQLEKSLNYFKK